MEYVALGLRTGNTDCRVEMHLICVQVSHQTGGLVGHHLVLADELTNDPDTQDTSHILGTGKVAQSRDSESGSTSHFVQDEGPEGVPMVTFPRTPQGTAPGEHDAGIWVSLQATTQVQ